MYKEKAIPMISVDPSTGKYVFEEEAAQFLRSVPGPIGVISVAGLYRTGKSYLLNRMLLNRSNGFGVGPTVNPCTKGLWCWGTPLKGQTSDGQSINVIVIDTEGIGALDEDQTHDTRIFTLAILASSCFIYNSVGSIDETAVQSLSLVVNLTKHIHLKTQSKSEEDTDPDEFANFFPSFYWVVRDFALQLIDATGDAINSKEYLEKALAPQKGFTDDVEEKNRIRRLLTTFFKERECFTLIRPCLEEEKLRILDKLNFEDLRPDFVEQVMNFRKRVMNKMKPKMINDKKLNGEMYFSLMRNYVGAINDGAVPNIENAWNYMCREQCHKISAEAYDLFETRFKEALSQKVPCPDEDFKNASRYAKDQAYELFKKKAFGDNIDDFMKDLKKKMRAKIQSIKAQNEKESMSAAHSYIVRNFSAIEKKLRLQEFKTYNEFEKEMAGLYAHALESGPKLPNSKLVYLEFMRKVLPQGADFFFRSSENEFEKLKTLAAERQKNSDREVKELREQLNKDRKSATDKLTSLDREKVELTMKVERLTEDLDKLTKDREMEVQRLSKTLDSRQSELQNLRKSLQQKVAELNQKNEDMNVKLVTGEKEWQKQKAILELKVKQLTTQTEELQKKQKLFDSTMNSAKSELNFQLKENSLKYDKKISELTLELNEFKEKSSELMEELKSIKEELENNKDKFDKKEKKLKEDLNIRIKEIQKLKHETQLEKNKYENDCELSKEQTLKELRETTEMIKKHELSIKNLTDQMKAQKSSSDKEIAILTQKLGFAEENLREAKQQLVEAKANHEASIAAMEEANGRLKEENENERIIELKNAHARDMKNAETEWENTRKKMQFDLDTFSKTKNELELKVSLLESTATKEKTERDAAQKKLDERIETLTNQLNSLQRNKNGRLREQEVFFENKIKELERELEEAQEKANHEQRESHSKSEEAITQLKNYYELEKEKLENKLALEKEKAEKKYKKMVEEYEQKHKDEINQLEEENEQIREEYISLETNMQNTVSHLQHENDIKSKQIESLDKALSELKQTSSRRQSELNIKYENLSQTTRTEKQMQYEKIEGLQTENNKKQKIIMTLTHAKEQLTTSLEKREAAIEDLKRESADLKATYDKAIEDYKKRNQDLSNEYLERKIGYEKTNALLQQENDFYSKKVKDLERERQSTVQNYEERLRAIKEETLNEIRSQNEKYQSERQLVEQKYEKLKKTSRETEVNLQKQLVELDKEKAIDQEKYINLEQKLKDTEIKARSEVQSLNSQIISLRESAQTDRKGLQIELERVKELLSTLENDKSEVVSNYEKDKILWENKLNFLEQQNKQSKTENSEKIRKLQATIDNLQRNRQNEKFTTESQHNEYVSKIEKKYISQISEMNENNTKKMMEYESTIKELELQLKNLNEKYALDIHSKMGNAAASEKRLAEVLESEKRLQAEVERLRLEKDQRTVDFQKQLEQEKEAMKNKVKDAEERLKQMQNQKRNMFFEHEKEKAKWQFEQDHRREKMEAMQEQISKNSSELQKLHRQNERLKAEKKNAKATGMQSFLASKWPGYNPDEKKMNKSNLVAGEFTTILTQDDEDSTNKENLGLASQFDK